MQQQNISFKSDIFPFGNKTFSTVFQQVFQRVVNIKNIDFIRIFHFFHIVVNIFVWKTVWKMLIKCLYKEYKNFILISAKLIIE